MKRYALHLITLLCFTLAVAVLAPQPAAADDDDPPNRVARLGFIQGTVSFEPAGTDDWVSAVVNRPLTTGDKLWNDNDSLSELNTGSATIRLGSNTGFSFLNLTDNMAQIQLTEGTLNIRIRRLDDDETFEVDTPNLAFTLLRPGNYKINVNEAGDATVVLVRSGEGEITGAGSAYTIHPREVGVFTGIDQIDADFQAWDDTSDDFDNWCSERDSRIEHSVSARYVSDDVIGYQDLDEYGGWRQTQDYGPVWFPHVTIAGWAPYHYGHWAYIAPWGYTWVDDAPWGFAPFHYGRWVAVGGVWGWVPAPPRPTVMGVAYVRPVYAPALVAWVGGTHFAVGVAVGGGASVGWFPLGPREVYVPSYHVSRTYVTNINVSNTRVETTVVNNYYNRTVINRNVTNVTYVNQRVPGAVTATSQEAFTSARSVSRNSVIINQREVTNARVGFAAPTVAPSRQAVLGAGVVVRARPPIVMENRVVVVKNTPPPPPPSFARQQRAIQANGGRPLAVSQIRQIQPERSEVRNNVRVAPVATPRSIQADRDTQRNPNRGFRQHDDRTAQPNPDRGARPNSYRDGQANLNRDARPDSYRDAEPNRNRDGQANSNRDAQPNSDRVVQPNQNRPMNPGNSVNNSGNAPATGTHERIYTDRPSNAAPIAPVNAPNIPVVTTQPDTNRVVQPNQHRAINPGNSVNNSGNAPVTGTHERGYTDRPSNAPSTTPPNTPNAPVVNPQPEPRNQPEPQNLRAERPGAVRAVAPPSNATNPNNVNPRSEQRNQPAPQNLHSQQNQELPRYDQQRPQPRQQEEKKQEQKRAKPAKEDKPSKNNK